MRSRNAAGEFADEPGTVLCRSRAQRYARALRIAMSAHNYRIGYMSKIAARMGYSQVHVSRVLAAVRSPTDAFLGRACSVLGCDRRILDVLAGERHDDSPVVQFLLGRFIE